MKTFIFYLIQTTWGLLVNIFGGILYIICKIKEYGQERFFNASVTYIPGKRAFVRLVFGTIYFCNHKSGFATREQLEQRRFGPRIWAYLPGPDTGAALLVCDRHTVFYLAALFCALPSEKEYFLLRFLYRSMGQLFGRAVYEAIDFKHPGFTRIILIHRASGRLKPGLQIFFRPFSPEMRVIKQIKAYEKYAKRITKNTNFHSIN